MTKLADDYQYIAQRLAELEADKTERINRSALPTDETPAISDVYGWPRPDSNADYIAFGIKWPVI